MKIKRLHEESQNMHFSANKLSKKFGKIFFSELDEFYKIIVNYNEDLQSFNYSICFNRLYKESVEQMEKLNIFIGLTKDGWEFETNDFEDGNGFVIYTEFNLPPLAIIKYLTDIEKLEQSNKFNI